VSHVKKKQEMACVRRSPFNSHPFIDTVTERSSGLCLLELLSHSWYIFKTRKDVSPVHFRERDHFISTLGRATNAQTCIASYDNGAPKWMHNFVENGVTNLLRTCHLNEGQGQCFTSNGNMSGTEQAQADFVHRSHIRSDQGGIVIRP
jgi:hypothetical protein